MHSDRLKLVFTHRFRWAELQLAIFLDDNSPFRLAEDVISNLDRLEEEVGLPDLDSVYDEIYQKNTRDGTHDRVNVIKTFKFLLYSFVEWNVHDLATAISIDMKGELNLAIDASYVLDICSNFLFVDYSGYVQFAHLSVPEYFKGGRSAIVFSDMDAHAQIAEVCLAYVMSPSTQEILKKRELDRRQVIHQKVFDKALHRKGRPLRRPIDFPAAGRDDSLGFHVYAFLLCLEHCELASIVKKQKGTALCSLFTTFMSVVGINPAFLTWIQSSLKAKIFPIPLNWISEKEFSSCRIKRSSCRIQRCQTRADLQDTFFAACAYGFTELLQDMMRSVVNMDVNRRNEEGAPGIWVASRYGHFPVVELLLDEGAEFDSRRNGYGFTPLYEATVWGHANIVALLLSRGVDATAPFRDDDPDGHDEENKVAVDTKISEADETLLHATIREWESKPMDESMMSSIVSSLLKHGLLIDVFDWNLQTPLHIACSENNSLAVSVLLHHDASPGAQDRQGRTPLMYSVMLMAPPVVLELLLKKASTADIVRRDNAGHSVLSHSIGSPRPGMTMLLLNSVDLRAVRELDTQEGDEFVELSDVLKRIGCDVLSDLGESFDDITDEILSQRSAINCLQAIGENIVMGKVDWCDADLCDKLRKEGVAIWSDLTEEGKEDDTDNDDDADADNDTNGNDDGADKDNVDDDDDTDSKIP